MNLQGLQLGIRMLLKVQVMNESMDCSQQMASMHM